MEILSMYMEVLFPCIWRFFPCIWRFCFNVYGVCPWVWRFCFHVYGSCPCIWRFISVYMEFDAMYMEAIFYFRVEFPEFGMTCPVQGCLASSFYRKFNQLKRDWYNINVQDIMMHHCIYCSKECFERRHAKSHVKTHRTSAGLPITITDFKRMNNGYMSPGSATLPRPRFTPTRSDVTNLSAREQAAERQRLADVCQQSEAAKMSKRGRG